MIVTRIKLITALAFGLGSTAPLYAQDMVGEAGGWGIYRDASMGNGCYMMSAFENGSVVQMGFDLAEDISFLTLFHAEWSDLTPNETYIVGFNLDGEAWEAEGLGIADSDLGGVIVPIEDPDFIVDLALKRTLSMSYEGEELLALDLTGSNAAVQATISCLEG